LIGIERVMEREYYIVVGKKILGIRD